MQNKTLNGPAETPDDSAELKPSIGRKLSGLLLLIVLAITLAFGLVPRGSFKENWLEWDAQSLRTEFGAHGVVHGEFPDLSDTFDRYHQLIFDLDIVPRAFLSGDFRVLVQLDYFDDPEPFIIGQWEDRLIVMQGRDYANKERRPRLAVDVGEFIGEELNVLITLNDERNELYLNGQFIRHHSPSTYKLGKPNARISVGNSPDGKHGWSGGVKNLDIRLLNLQTQQGESLRSFDFQSEHDKEIQDLSPYAANLHIPKPGNFPDKVVLQKSSPKELIAKNRIDLILNFIGFAPLGLLLAVVFSQRFSASRYMIPLFGAILVGGVVSLGIEVSQPMIPGRNSHLHDLILNVLGAAAGGMMFVIGAYIIALFRPNQPAQIPPG